MSYVIPRTERPQRMLAVSLIATTACVRLARKLFKLLCTQQNSRTFHITEKTKCTNRGCQLAKNKKKCSPRLTAYQHSRNKQTSMPLTELIKFCTSLDTKLATSETSLPTNHLARYYKKSAPNKSRLAKEK